MVFLVTKCQYLTTSLAIGKTSQPVPFSQLAGFLSWAGQETIILLALSDAHQPGMLEDHP
eukprot:3896370-Pleurochrysis_carterae.AAC.1